jgi:hypothetical protein
MCTIRVAEQMLALHFVTGTENIVLSDITNIHLEQIGGLSKSYIQKVLSGLAKKGVGVGTSVREDDGKKEYVLNLNFFEDIVRANKNEEIPNGKELIVNLAKTKKRSAEEQIILVCKYLKKRIFKASDVIAGDEIKVLGFKSRFTFTQFLSEAVRKGIYLALHKKHRSYVEYEFTDLAWNKIYSEEPVQESISCGETENNLEFIDFLEFTPEGMQALFWIKDRVCKFKKNVSYVELPKRGISFAMNKDRKIFEDLMRKLGVFIKSGNNPEFYKIDVYKLQEVHKRFEKESEACFVRLRFLQKKIVQAKRLQSKLLFWQQMFDNVSDEVEVNSESATADLAIGEIEDEMNKVLGKRTLESLEKEYVFLRQWVELESETQSSLRKVLRIV